MVGVGSDLCGSSGPTPLPKQGHLQQAKASEVGGWLAHKTSPNVPSVLETLVVQILFPPVIQKENRFYSKKTLFGYWSKRAANLL